MKNQLLTLAGVLALLAVLGHSFEKQLLAQVRAALVQNVDEPGRNPITLTGSTSGDTTLTVPPGKRYVIQTFGGVCSVALTDQLTAIIFQGGGGQALAPAFRLIGGQTSTHWAANATTHMYFDPGSIVGWDGITYNGTSSSCNFVASGYSITLP